MTIPIMTEEEYQKKLRRINRRAPLSVEEYRGRVRRIVYSNERVDLKISRFHSLMDEMASVYDESIVPCHRGCGHCCHIHVPILKQEAEFIGRKIGVKPHSAPHEPDRNKKFDFGYHNPCTFLENGECSIYEHRPLVCRSYFSVENDPALCGFPDGKSKKIHSVRILVLEWAMEEFLVGSTGPLHEADIRAFFPEGRQKKQAA